jgi:hypothetical protein
MVPHYPKDNKGLRETYSLANVAGNATLSCLVVHLPCSGGPSPLNEHYCSAYQCSSAVDSRRAVPDSQSGRLSKGDRAHSLVAAEQLLNE